MESVIGLAPTAYSALRALIDLIKAASDAAETVTTVKGAVQGPIERRRARAVYWEVVYNAGALTLGQSLQPPTVLATRHEWDQPNRAGDLATFLSEGEVAMVSAPYIELDNYRWLFSRGTLELLVTRLRGEDQQVLERLAQSFRDAEFVLRRHLFNKHQQTKIGEALQSSGMLKPPKRQRGQRIRSAISTIPLSAPLTLLALLYISRAVGALEKMARRKPQLGPRDLAE